MDLPMKDKLPKRAVVLRLKSRSGLGGGEAARRPQTALFRSVLLFDVLPEG